VHQEQGGPRRRSVLVPMGIVAVLGVASTARADASARLDCYLESEIGVTCRDVVQAFGSSIPGLAITGTSDDRASITIALRESEIAGGHRFFADFAGRPSAEPDRDEPLRFTLTHDVPTSAGNDRALLVLVALLQRGMVPFLRVEAPGETDGSTLRISASAVASGARDAAPPTGWYARPMLAGELVSAGLMIASVEGGLEISYSDPDWRFRVIGEATYRYLDLPLGDTRLVGDFTELDGRAVIARSLGSGVSLAVLGGAGSEPQNNFEVRGHVALGGEWVLASFLRANDANVGTRVELRGRYDAYVTPSLELATERWYVEPALTVFGRVHSDVIDIEARGSASFLADAPRFWTVGGQLETTLRLADGLTLALEASVGYRGAAAHAPADPSALSAVATTLAGTNFGELTAGAEATVSWAFGNSLLRSQDQRWR
jgi:hypothetical protein